MPRSIVGWFVACWTAFLVGACVVGALLLLLYNDSTTERLKRAVAAIAHSCDAITARYQFFMSGTTTAPADLHASGFARQLGDVVRIALRDADGVEGGIWQVDSGSLAYAFPTYEGSGEKSDLPEAELPAIRQTAETAALNAGPADQRTDSRSQSLLVRACPLPGPIPHLAAWTMTRVVTVGGRTYLLAVAGLGLLLLVVLGSAGWLGYLLRGWSRRLRQIEAGLAGSAEELPRLELTGQRDLDRIVSALNRAGDRVAEARTQADALHRRIVANERLAALGRMAASIAHEVRNPIAAMRLKAENAVADGAGIDRKNRALTIILQQIERLDELVRNLLLTTRQEVAIATAAVDVAALIEARVSLYSELAAAKGITLERRVVPDALSARLDRSLVAQALDNLILNALQNTPPAGRVTVSAERTDATLAISVADTGRGVPAEIAPDLFEPFVSDRPDGTGLGLAIVRETAESHGGTVRFTSESGGAAFILELPWRPS
jgi:signal transduction histidine kinase